MNSKTTLLVAVPLFMVIWFFVMYSSLRGTSNPSNDLNEKINTDISSNSDTKQIKIHTPNRKLVPPTRYVAEAVQLAPPPLEEIKRNMTLYLQTLHKRLGDIAGPTVTATIAWETFLDVTKSMPMVWDAENKERIPKPRNDGSVFVALGSYRDPFCPMTMKSLYSMAKDAEKIFVGLFQQNCFGPVCRTGVLKGGKVENAGPDLDCYVEFCNSPEGIKSNACNNGNVRLFNVNESESLGPYMARYMGAKFYGGEQYYLQIDSHSEFVKDWDYKLIQMVVNAPAEKPVISTYPPGQGENWRDSTGLRLCDSEFASAQIEWQIIRLGSPVAFDKKTPKVAKYAPFIAAGFFFAPASCLSDVPFDPFLPWIFMGEEISMSARLWTAGYDIFSPTTNVLNHYYVRRHYPKFWETTNRFFKKPIHNDIVEIVIKRVKCMLGYPEARAELIHPNSALYRMDEWGMGRQRSFAAYMQMVGIDPVSKIVTPNNWCHNGEWPSQAQQYFVHK
jgi:[Skp1-protein]-hydroxyproline N-acetylglucosaminyltransferase